MYYSLPKRCPECQSRLYTMYPDLEWRCTHCSCRYRLDRTSDKSWTDSWYVPFVNFLSVDRSVLGKEATTAIYNTREREYIMHFKELKINIPQLYSIVEKYLLLK